MSNSTAEGIPKDVKAAIEGVEKSLGLIRIGVKLTLDLKAPLRQLDRVAVAQLYAHAVAAPDLSKLVESLVKMGIREVMDASFKPLQDKVSSLTPDVLAMQIRKRKMLSLILAGALSEQHVENTDGPGAGGYCAHELEKIMDNWIKHGQYRKAAGNVKNSMQLNNIAAFLESKESSQAESIVVRFGLITPVVADMRIWTYVEALALKSPAPGWGERVNDGCVEVAPVVSLTPEG